MAFGDGQQNEVMAYGEVLTAEQYTNKQVKERSDEQHDSNPNSISSITSLNVSKVFEY